MQAPGRQQSRSKKSLPLTNQNIDNLKIEGLNAGGGLKQTKTSKRSTDADFFNSSSKKMKVENVSVDSKLSLYEKENDKNFETNELTKTVDGIKKEDNKSPTKIDNNIDEQDTNKNSTSQLNIKFVKDEHDSDQSDNEIDESFNYIKLREANMKANEEFFASLGVNEAKMQLHSSTPKQSKYAPTSNGLKRASVKKPEPQITRRSLRQRRIDPEGVALPEPEPTLSAHGVPDDEYRLPDGPVSFKDCMFSKAANQSEEDVQKFSSLIYDIKKYDIATKICKELKPLKAKLDNIKINERRVAKVVLGQVFSVSWHPSTNVLMTGAGDKYGHVGLWKVPSGKGDSSDSVVTFKPHIKPVSDLQFDSLTNKLFTCSYDATLRCGDFEKGVFDEVFSMPVEDDDLLRNFDFLDGGKTTMLVSHFRGLVSLVDVRTPGTNAEKSFKITRRSLRTVSLHPITKNHFVTAGVEAKVCLWDLRNLSEKNPKPLQILSHHNKAIASAYFSPNGKSVISSSADDTIAICSVSDSMKIELSKVIRHNNHTGRWLTSFRPMWHPVVNEAFITGSMRRPREIEVYSTNGSVIKSIQDEEFLGSVCSLNEFHPNLECAIVGANSSGRLHVFM